MHLGLVTSFWQSQVIKITHMSKGHHLQGVIIITKWFPFPKVFLCVCVEKRKYYWIEVKHAVDCLCIGLWCLYTTVWPQAICSSENGMMLVQISWGCLWRMNVIIYVKCLALCQLFSKHLINVSHYTITCSCTI